MIALCVLLLVEDTGKATYPSANPPVRSGSSSSSSII